MLFLPFLAKLTRKWQKYPTHSFSEKKVLLTTGLNICTNIEKKTPTFSINKPNMILISNYKNRQSQNNPKKSNELFMKYDKGIAKETIPQWV